jgi:regulation of enolase protein 1 (concanavalin A-like superfamily)
LLLFLSSLPSQDLCAQQNELGIFQASADIGSVEIAGSAVYLTDEDRYVIRGAGENMWFAKDEFHFVYRKMTGDFTLQTRAEFVGEGVNAHRKLGWMIRASLDSSAAYVDATVHGDGLTSMQFRPEQGADTEEIQSEISGPELIRLQRKGDTYIMAVGHSPDSMEREILSGIQLGDTVYVGLFVCSHEEDVIEEAVFTDVQIKKDGSETAPD